MKNKITKERLVEEIVLLVEEQDISSLTLKELANRLGIKTPSLYNHINGLEDAYDILAYEALTQLKTKLIDAIIGLAGKEALVALANAYRNFALASPNLYMATQTAKFWTRLETKEAADDIAILVSKIINTYGYNEEMNIHIVRTLRSYLHGFVSIEIQEAFAMPVVVDKSFEIGLKAILDSLELS